MEKVLSEAKKKEILDHVVEIKKRKDVKGKVTPIVVFGREEDGEKEIYVGYFGEPSMKAFSKFMTMSKTDEVRALQILASDIFIEGDRELVDSESLFLLGTMPMVNQLLAARQSVVVGL